MHGLGQVLISLDCTMNMVISIQPKWCKRGFLELTNSKRPSENTWHRPKDNIHIHPDQLLCHTHMYVHAHGGTKYTLTQKFPPHSHPSGGVMKMSPLCQPTWEICAHIQDVSNLHTNTMTTFTYTYTQMYIHTPLPHSHPSAGGTETAPWCHPTWEVYDMPNEHTVATTKIIHIHTDNHITI